MEEQNQIQKEAPVNMPDIPPATQPQPPEASSEATVNVLAALDILLEMNIPQDREKRKTWMELRKTVTEARQKQLLPQDLENLVIESINLLLEMNIPVDPQKKKNWMQLKKYFAELV